MKLNFSKRILEKYTHASRGFFESCAVYTIYAEDKVLGSFICAEKLGYIDYEDRAFRIEINHYHLKNDTYNIFDAVSQTQVGKYRIPILFGGYMGVGTLLLGKEEYSCKKLKPSVPYSLFKKNTWGHYRVLLSNKKETVVYECKLNRSILFSTSLSGQPFDGEMEMNTNNWLLSFAGLFLLEQIFVIKDQSTS